MKSKRNLSHYQPIHHYGKQDSCLTVSGRSIEDIVEKAGYAPTYVYSSEVIRQRIGELKQQLPEGISLHYAIKANPMPEVVNFISPLLDGLDVASGSELELALASGMSAEEISFAGPGKSLQELSDSVEAGITINVESELELLRIKEIGEQKKITPRVALRINPDFELKTSGMKMSGGPKPFGVDAEVAPKLIDTIASSNLEFMGFHIFSGSQNLRADAIIESQTKTFALAQRLSRDSGMRVRKLNIGGGFGIPYFPGDEPLDVEPISCNLSELMRQYAEDFSQTEIIIELGRYIVGEAGLYICQVTDKKISRGTTYLITNGGLHHHLAASGNFGQVVRKNYPVTVGNKLDSQQETVSVVGPLCTPLDILGNNMALPKAEVGDLIVVFQSGAYGYTASPHHFLSHPHPRQVFI